MSVFTTIVKKDFDLKSITRNSLRSNMMNVYVLKDGFDRGNVFARILGVLHEHDINSNIIVISESECDTSQMVLSRIMQRMKKYETIDGIIIMNSPDPNREIFVDYLDYYLFKNKNLDCPIIVLCPEW